MIRKAQITDAQECLGLINFWAKKGRVLERSLNYLYENIRDFWVYFEGDKMVGCCALKAVGWQGLGEIKSLAVAEEFKGQGIGSKLVKECLKEAKELGLKEVFALTFASDFFRKLGFEITEKEKLPHKIWSDCINCVYFPNCREEAVSILL
ncbi:MAG: N-acetyltransferase [Candidatus Omnitrophota bacterium]